MKRIKLLVIFAAGALLISGLLTGLAWAHGNKECKGHGHAKARPLTGKQWRILRDFARDHREVKGEYLQKMLSWNEAVSKALDAITLTKDQEAALVKIMSSRVDQYGANADPIVKDGIALKDALLAEKVSDKAVLAASAQLAKDLGESAVLVSQMVQEARQTLTPEQWAAVKDLINKGAAEGDDALKRLPGQVNDALGLIKELNLSPEQIAYLMRFEPKAARMQHRHMEREQHFIWHKLRRILSRKQREILKDYLKPRRERAEKAEREELAKWVEAYLDLNLTQEQLDKLLELVSGKQKELVANKDAVARAGFKLRDEVLAEKADAAKIRKAAKDLGNAIGRAALLGSDLIKSAKGILNNEQWELVLAKVAEVQGQIQDEVKKKPDELNAAIKLWNDLDLSLEQQAQLKKLAQRELEKHERMVKHELHRQRP